MERCNYYVFKTRRADADTARNHSLSNGNYRGLGENDRRSVGSNFQNAQRLHLRPGRTRSPIGRGSIFNAPGSSTRLPPRDVLGDEDEEDDSDCDASVGGPGCRKYKNTPVRQALYSSRSTSSAPESKARQGRTDTMDKKPMAGGDESSPDDTGYDRGGSIGGGRADSHSRGGYQLVSMRIRRFPMSGIGARGA